MKKSDQQQADLVRALVNEQRGVQNRIEALEREAQTTLDAAAKAVAEKKASHLRSRLDAIEAEMKKAGHEGAPPARRAEKRPASAAASEKRE